MNMIQLRDRLNDIIRENERRGWADRNLKPVVIALKRPYFKRMIARYIPIEFVCGHLLGLPKTVPAEYQQVMIIEAREGDALKTGPTE